jgi:hypothetical protein
MSDKKLYAVGCYTPEDWTYIHEILTKDGTLEDNIPYRDVFCADSKEHSETRSVYLLDDAEAKELSNHPRVKFVNIDYSSYREEFMPPADKLYATPRYTQPVKNYRNFYDTGILPTTPTSADINRGGYQLLRCTERKDPWQGIPSSTVVTQNIEYTNDGTDVDVIVGDDGMWFGHSEFQNNTGNGPANYRGGNVLPGNGTCDLLDLVLDSPYYIDPDWFNADPGNRLTTRWDGTTVPVESVSKLWWTNSTQRSAQFASIGVISSIPTGYTRAYCNGSYTTISSVGDHGTPCCALTYGRTQGWAYNANKWALNVYNTNGLDFEPYFDMMKLFHLYKPINPKYGNKNPTISSNSWGYRAISSSTGYYYYRVGTSGASGISYTTKPGFMNYVGVYGDGNRMKGEHPDNSATQAGEEMINAGVIFVAAAGNSNQKQVSSDHPDYDNYWSINPNTALGAATHNEFGIFAYNTTNRRGYPQHLGKYTENGKVVYPVINIGALDDSYMGSGKERKVNYSDMGNEIDCYAPADGTLAAQWASSGGYRARPDIYGPSFVDNGFTAICNASSQIAATIAFNAAPNTGHRITTSSVTVGTYTTIPNSILGTALMNLQTTPTVGNNNDGYWNLSLPFNIQYLGSAYSTIYVGTNSYLTFGNGSIAYTSFGFNLPPYPKIMISSANNSAQRLYYVSGGSGSNRTYRIRFEGTASLTGSDVPNMVWEMTFYEANPSQIDIQIGLNARYSSRTFYDEKFSGTSAACPVACGLIATLLQTNRNWTWKDVRSYLKNNIELQDTNYFYTGRESVSANDTNWADVNSLEGGDPRIIYNAPVAYSIPRFMSGSGLKLSGNGLKFFA